MDRLSFSYHIWAQNVTGADNAIGGGANIPFHLHNMPVYTSLFAWRWADSIHDKILA